MVALRNAAVEVVKHPSQRSCSTRAERWSRWPGAGLRAIVPRCSREVPRCTVPGGTGGAAWTGFAGRPALSASGAAFQPALEPRVAGSLLRSEVNFSTHVATPRRNRP